MISKKAIDLIVQYEVGGKSYYDKVMHRPTFPGFNSGIKIGIGYNLAYTYQKQLINDWTGNINPNYFPALFRVLGLKGIPAKQMLIGDLLKVTIPYLNAYDVLIKRTIPRYYLMALEIYPELSLLNEDTKGAIVSMVMCRGIKLDGENRVEMRELVELIANKDYDGIADAVERSKRLCEVRGLDELVKRREAEADLILQSI